ncbi:MAG: glycine cleavage system protein GcvH [Proteobacteria bacterium]|nr:glycine cleavage system protein GcvH [Pseudomonadota bacterium]
MAEYEIPGELLYSREDEWARRESDRVVVGITDYAQQQLGDVVFVELPKAGTVVERGEPFGVIESVKAVSDLYAPLSGEVIEVNVSLDDSPEVVNEACYGDGWIIAIEASDPNELKELLDAAAYAQYIEERKE